MSKKDLPPVPPESHGKGPAAPQRAEADAPKPGPRENLAEQGRQGNIKQNTTHQGYQQDR